MAALAHLGVALASKQAAPQVHIGALVAATYALDIVWTGFWVVGLEHYPEPGIVQTSPWSHGLLMASIWSVLMGLGTLLVTRNRRTSLLIWLAVFSHWVVDFIAKPMTYAYPSDAGLPLLFDGSPTVGLGVWATAAGQQIGEYGTLIVGLGLYLLTVLKGRAKAKQLSHKGGAR